MSETNEPDLDTHADLDTHVTETVEKVREVTPYEKRLRTEAAANRVKLREAQAARDADVANAIRERDEAVAAAQRERDEKIASIETASTQRLIRAEMKAAAIKAGMVDPDGLKLLDLSGVKLDEAGEVIVPDGFFEAAKTAKPFLFGAPSSSSTAAAPRQEPPTARRATEWTAEEVAAANARLARGQRLTA